MTFIILFFVAAAVLLAVTVGLAVLVAGRSSTAVAPPAVGVSEPPARFWFQPDDHCVSVARSTIGLVR